MRGLNDFIVHIPEKYRPTYKTESGLELHADRRWSLKKVANTVIQVLETPLNYNGPIKKGCNLFIDPTVLMSQIYPKTGEQENLYVVDREKSLYRIRPEFVIAYSMGAGTQWIGFENNILLDRIYEGAASFSSSSIISIPKGNIMVRGRATILIPNENNDFQEGQLAFFNEEMAIDVYLGDVPLIWLRVKDIQAVLKLKSA